MDKSNNCIVEIRVCSNGARLGKILNVVTHDSFWKFLSLAEIEACEGHWNLLIAESSFNVIDYVSQKGEMTRRTITVSRIWIAGNGNTCVRAYCHKRSESRTFNFDSIAEVVA